MPDREMCRNNKCKHKSECLRFTDVPRRNFQAYGNFKVDDDGKCMFFIDNGAKRKE